MPNDPSERVVHGVIESLWIFGESPVLRPCDGCCDPIEPGEKCYRPAGFLTKPGLPNVTARDIRVMETYCLDCGAERRAFLLEALKIIKPA